MAIRRFELLKRLECRADDVDRIVASQRLRQHVLDTCCLDDGAHAATGDNAGARRRRASAAREKRRTMSRSDAGIVVPSSGTGSCAFFAASTPFRIESGTSFALPRPGADTTFAVADHDDRAEAEAAAATDDFGHAIDLDDPFFEFACRPRRRSAAVAASRLDPYPYVTPSVTSRLTVRRDSLEGQSGFARAFGDRFDTAVVENPPRSKTMASMPAAFARSPITLAHRPGLGTLGRLRAGAIEYVLLQVTGSDSVRPRSSSMTWA